MDPNVIPNVSVDCVVIGYDLQDISILLIEREMVYNGKKYIDLKLPGDLVRWDEDIDSSAYRILFDLSGVQISNLKQLQAFGEVDRLKKEPRDMEWLRAIDHPEERVITVAYYTLVSLDLIHSQKFKPNPNARWVPISKIGKLAFDHNRIINKALDTLRQEIKQTPVAFDLLPRKFTLSQMQKLYEVVMGTLFDKRNFRKKIAQIPCIVPIKEKQVNVPHKPARYYMFSRDVYEVTRKDNFDFSV
ncbi:MAG TPA: DNA mismatch repair protein MutT [Bacteroidales bacterium]|nr:DNA mismatch repair protein MutT [Bacteroidales bacterium]